MRGEYSDGTNHPNIRALFEALYMVRMPEMYLRTEDDVRARGTPTTGDLEVDMALQNSMVRAYRTINQIFELWKLGVDIAVINYDDTRKIYEAIQKHLLTWREYIHKEFQLHLCPLAELIELDKFANTVYDKARYVFSDETIKDLNVKFNNLGISLTPGSMFANKLSQGFFFNHHFKSERELKLERNKNYRATVDRRSLETEFVDIAMRYDVPISGITNEVKPIDLKFAND